MLKTKAVRELEWKVSYLEERLTQINANLLTVSHLLLKEGEDNYYSLYHAQFGKLVADSQRMITVNDVIKKVKRLEDFLKVEEVTEPTKTFLRKVV